MATGAKRPSSKRRVALWDPRGRVERIAAITGSVRRAAELLEVDVAQASRWASGEQIPGPGNARVLLDVDYVVTFALTVWADPAVVEDWLTTPNAHLDGAIPVERIRREGASEVVAALRAEAAGSYA